VAADEKLTVSGDVVYREIEGEAVLLDLASGRYFGLNAVGTRVWAVLAGGGRVDDAVAAIAEEFDASETQIAADVRALVDTLVARGLLLAGA
jgi:hypothetical protein